MERDVVFHFNKNTFVGTILGEIQKGFDMGLTIDGTKDSVTLLVHSYVDYEIEPQTIIWHKKTNTWWVVSHDKVERYCNDSGYYYIHNLDLLGAIELTNARDLTDCGFNDNTYNIRQFFERLISLSTFEYSPNGVVFSSITSQGLLTKNVDYVKTFENYTLLSAIREFLDSYNCCCKLTFDSTYLDAETIRIDNAVFDIIERTGNNSSVPIDIETFDQVKEIKTIDKNSFGACVVSNCQNVISSQPKTYPSNGLIGLSSNEYEIKINQDENADNTLLRLPSNVYKVNWLKLIAINVKLTFALGANVYYFLDLYYSQDEQSLQKINDRITSGDIYSDYQNGYINQTQYEYVRDHVNEIWEKAKEYHTITFYNGIEYDANGNGNGGIYTKPDNIPYIPEFEPSISGDPQKIAMFPKQIRDSLDRVGGYLLAIYWERGSNVIRGFNFLDRNHRAMFNTTDGYYNEDSENAVIYQDSDNLILISARNTIDTDISLNFVYKFMTSESERQPALFKVNYIPMSDVKMKVDNQHNKLDIQLYNQNGKLVDNVALERLVNSYAKEISSDNITRYKNYYSFNDIPKVGSLVYKGNDMYVINNISMSFTQNESTNSDNFGYYIECEFTMSKHISAKSLMVNPNQNIRDYLIPQQFNVKRKQLYRDYWELAYSEYSDSSHLPLYVPLEELFTLEHEYTQLQNFSTMMEIEYDEPIGGDSAETASEYWYYQLECVTIACGKQIIVICDFNDNNIIGYSPMNRRYMFNLQNLFNQNSMVNTPISYVDTKGKFKGITLLFLTQDQRATCNDLLYSASSYSAPYDALLTQCFIPSELYDIAFFNRHKFHIIEENYNKDATEVPVFEYCGQVGDSNDVLIGDNALSQHANRVYFYSFVKGTNLTQNNVAPESHVTPNQELTSLYVLNGVDLQYGVVNNKYVLKVGLYLAQRRRNSDGIFINQPQASPLAFDIGYDYAIFRHSFDLETNAELIELMFIAKKVPSDNIDSNGYLVLYQNHYLLR